MKHCKQPPVESLTPLPQSLTWSATIDDEQGEREITELMIRRACEQMDAEQQFPFRHARQAPRIPLRDAINERNNERSRVPRHTGHCDNVIALFDYMGAA